MSASDHRMSKSISAVESRPNYLCTMLARANRGMLFCMSRDLEHGPMVREQLCNECSIGHGADLA